MYYFPHPVHVGGRSAVGSQGAISIAGDRCGKLFFYELLVGILPPGVYTRVCAYRKQISAALARCKGLFLASMRWWNTKVVNEERVCKPRYIPTRLCS